VGGWVGGWVGVGVYVCVRACVRVCVAVGCRVYEYMRVVVKECTSTKVRVVYGTKNISVVYVTRAAA